MAIADALGMSRQHLYDIRRERKPVSAEVAVRLGAAFGDGGVATSALGPNPSRDDRRADDEPWRLRRFAIA